VPISGCFNRSTASRATKATSPRRRPAKSTHRSAERSRLAKWGTGRSVISRRSCLTGQYSPGENPGDRQHVVLALKPERASRSESTTALSVRQPPNLIEMHFRDPGRFDLRSGL
jgi:hypothetical protein